MKLLSTLLFALFTVSVLSAQTPLERAADNQTTHLKSTDEISDFTVVDSDGNEWNLYSYLDGGATVILDLFQST